jgi:hypothetical protein
MDISQLLTSNVEEDEQPPHEQPPQQSQHLGDAPAEKKSQWTGEEDEVRSLSTYLFLFSSTHASWLTARR